MNYLSEWKSETRARATLAKVTTMPRFNTSDKLQRLDEALKAWDKVVDSDDGRRKYAVYQRLLHALHDANGAIARWSMWEVLRQPPHTQGWDNRTQQAVRDLKDLVNHLLYRLHQLDKDLQRYEKLRV